ncbi:helix-turn-helix domain-containing protein [Streptomyces sp. NPDC087843]|uniref:helix-turn-helix domain-containing protein n=1 Tax=Streptomyces sp. NPDC087843 TaxID=3365804 RepID=UPI00380FABF4
MEAAMPESGSRATFATELRRLRGELTLRQLAHRASCSKSHINDLEHERRSPTLPIARGLDKALGADGTLVALAEAQRRMSEEIAQTAADTAVDGLLREWDDVWRRDFLKSAGAAGAALVTGVGSGAVPSAGGRDLMDAHIALRAAHGRLDNLCGASAVYGPAVDHHRQILAWHAAASSTAERQQIAALAADTGGFVGFLTYDLGMAENAVAHYNGAAAYARQAGDLSSCINLIGQMSRILTDQGHYRRALALADGALHLAGTRAHPAVRSWLHAVRAHHHACLSDAGPSQQDLSTAWKLLDRADDGEKPPYIGYLGPAEMHKWTGHAMVRLGHKTPSLLRTGRIALEEARATWPATHVRGSAEMLTASARIHAASGDHDIAADFASHAVTVATQTGSARNLRAALDAVGRQR